MRFLYKYACFDCRVAFKRPATQGDGVETAHFVVSEACPRCGATEREEELHHQCPHCGRRMAFMGRHFAAPKKRDQDAWLAAQALWEAGFRFVGNGHNDPPLPRTQREVDDFVAAYPKHFQKVSCYRTWAQYTGRAR